MKLFYGPNSPFARKCRVIVLEKRLEKRVEFVSVNALENPPELLAINPLGTVPALVTDEGLHLCDSTVICEYLDTLSSSPIFYPTGDARICVLAMAAMADGIMDAAVQCVLESRRPEDKKYAQWTQRKEAAVMRAIAKFANVGITGEEMNIGTLNLAIALAYVDFRLPHLGWRTLHPQLAGWLDSFTQRPSLQATMPSL